MNILFDSEWLSLIKNKDSSRSGITLTSYALLKEFEKKHQIYIYLDYKTSIAIKKNPLFKNFKFIQPYGKKEVFLSYLYHYYHKLPKKLRIFAKIKKAFNSKRKLEVTNALNATQNRGKCFKSFKLIEKIDCYFSVFTCLDEDFLPDIPKFTLLHDIVLLIEEFDFFTPEQRKWFVDKVASRLRKEDFYFANSEFTKQDFLKFFPNSLQEKNIKTTLLGKNDYFYFDFNETKNKRIKEKYKIPKDKKYIFSLCTLDPRKNLIFVIENFLDLVEKEEIDDLIFVLAGGHWDLTPKSIYEKIKKSNQKVMHIGYVDDEDLSNLFSHSLCSIYLSLYEGFGLPVLESMQCGCPVIASNTTSIPEVGGDAAILIDPKDSKALKQSILKLYQNESLREELKQKGLKRAELFSWEKCANEMLDFMEEKCKNSTIYV